MKDMRQFDIVAVLLVLAAGLGYVNHRLLKLPPTVGMMPLTLLGSLAVMAIGLVYPEAEQGAIPISFTASTSIRRCSRECSASCSSRERCTSTWTT